MLYIVIYAIILGVSFTLFSWWGVVGALSILIIMGLIGAGLKQSNSSHTQLATLAEEYVTFYADVLAETTGTLHPKYYRSEVSTIMSQILNNGVGAISPDPTANKFAYEVSIGMHKVISLNEADDKVLIESVGKFMLRKALQNEKGLAV